VNATVEPLATFVGACDIVLVYRESLIDKLANLGSELRFWVDIDQHSAGLPRQFGWLGDWT
jgi:hypothetical protein